MTLVANNRNPMVVTSIMVEMDKIWHSETREKLTTCFDLLKEVCNIWLLSFVPNFMTKDIIFVMVDLCLLNVPLNNNGFHILWHYIFFVSPIPFILAHYPSYFASNNYLSIFLSDILLRLTHILIVICVNLQSILICKPNNENP